MDIFNNLLLWIHLSALAVGGAATFGIPAVGALVGGASPEGRPLLFKAIQRLSTVGRAAFVVLIISGPLLFWLKWSGSAPEAAWFGAKMALVLVLLGILIWSGINSRQATTGNLEAAKRQPVLGIAGATTLLAIVLCAAFAFN